jgi:hypothetical protein
MFEAACRNGVVTLFRGEIRWRFFVLVLSEAVLVIVQSQGLRSRLPARARYVTVIPNESTQSTKGGRPW